MSSQTDSNDLQAPRARHAHGFVSTLPDGRMVELHPVLPRLPIAGVARPVEGGAAAARVLPSLGAPLAAPTPQQAAALGVTLPIRWLAVAAGGSSAGANDETLGDGWFARHAGDPRSALLSLAVAPDFVGSGLARVLLETLVVGTIEHRIEQLYALLPSSADDCLPTLTRLGAEVTRGARGLLMARIDFRGYRRPLYASGPLARGRASA